MEQSVLILCRGLFTPGHNDAASRVYDNVHGAALRLEEGGYSLAGSFEEVGYAEKALTHLRVVVNDSIRFTRFFFFFLIQHCF